MLNPDLISTVSMSVNLSLETPIYALRQGLTSAHMTAACTAWLEPNLQDRNGVRITQRHPAGKAWLVDGLWVDIIPEC